jgi:hypothetical protein
MSTPPFILHNLVAAGDPLPELKKAVLGAAFGGVMRKRDDMKNPFLTKHWLKLAGIPFQALGAGGAPPQYWVRKYELEGVPYGAQLPDFQLDRNAVRSICRDDTIPVLHGYACAMAWGGQGGPFGGPHVRSAWAMRKQVKRHLEHIRSEELDRKESYALFLKDDTIKGLGPAYVTKLLYFFSPKLDHYIMDQWTAKSINLLAGREVVRMTGDYVSGTNTEENYTAFCSSVDMVAKLLRCTGDEAEQRIYSMGGKYPWPWRKHVQKHWKPA